MAYRPYVKNTDGTLTDIPLHAEIANKLGTVNKGNNKKPIYLVNGVPTEGLNIVDLIYPVGSIYLSVVSTSPATLFGGTWEKLQDRFLVGAGNSYSIGATGGEATHTLTTSELPSHKHDNTISVSASQISHMHSIPSGNGKCSNAGGLGYGYVYAVGGPDNDTSSRSNRTTTGTGTSVMNNSQPSITVSSSITNANTGSGSAHNNLPPYLAVNIWKRTA